MKPKRKPIRVRVTVEFEVDRDAYEEEFAETASAADIRQYVKGEVVTAAESAFAHHPSVEIKNWG